MTATDARFISLFLSEHLIYLLLLVCKVNCHKYENKCLENNLPTQALTASKTHMPVRQSLVTPSTTTSGVRLLAKSTNGLALLSRHGKTMKVEGFEYTMITRNAHAILTRSVLKVVFCQLCTLIALLVLIIALCKGVKGF